MNQWIYFSFIFFCIPQLFTSAWAQIVQSERIEIEIDGSSNDFVVVSAEDRGLMLFRETEERQRDGNKFWEFIYYDTNLQEKWKRTYALSSLLTLRGYDYDRGQLCVLFQKGQYQDKAMEMINMEVASGDTAYHTIRRIVPVNLEFFEIIGQTVVLGGNVNYKPVVVHYDMLLRKIKVLPDIYRENGEIIDIIPNKTDNTFDVLIAETTPEKIKTVTVKAYDQYSNLLQSTPLDPQGRRNLLDAQVTEFDGQRQFLAGTYGPKRSRYSRGLFIASLAPDGEQQIRYYNYADLENFFGYMRERREERVKRRMARKKQEGRKIRLNYRMVVHELISDGDKYIMLGEAYYPKYNSYYYSGFYGYGSSRYNNMYFDGYRYTHAIAVCFNKKGDLLWDHAFKLDNAKSMQLKQLVHISSQKDRVVLMYSYDGEITSKVIQDNGAVQDMVTSEVALPNPADEVKKNDKEVYGIEKWYDEYFYVHGTQDIRSIADSGLSSSRKVFFINKVAYN
ncbi:MAG: hypothetical protein RIG62_30380 [Cyclobacteriaceae bacterium]